jgi:mono/diheme cytochrome c family protein
MRRLWKPLFVGAVIVAAAFALAKARVFEPSVAKSAGRGDPYAGQLVFESKCAGCHGLGGRGGSTGPRLIGSGLTAAQVSAQIAQGGGIMPAGLVSGKDEADVVTYVVSIAKR